MTEQLQTDTQADRRKRKFSFFATALLKNKKNKKELPPLNFLSGFLSLPSFSTFASRAFLFVGKFTNKSHTGSEILWRKYFQLTILKKSLTKLTN